MQDFENIQTQLAQEEAALATANEQVQATLQQIDEAYGQIANIQAQVESSQQNIQKLKAHAAAIEKRIALLREYMEMAASQNIPTPPPAVAAQPPTPPPPTADHTPTSPPTPPADHTPTSPPTPPPDHTPTSPPTPPPAVEDELLPEFQKEAEPEDLEFGEPLTAPTDANAPATTERGVVTFDNMDDEWLTLELLPRTTTFEEELLLLMAYHRKAVKPKEIAKIFRRLDYTPKVSTTEKNIKQQVEADHHFFEYVADGRIALTDEGREEANQLLHALL
jgi:hypothetical protein